MSDKTNRLGIIVIATAVVENSWQTLCRTLFSKFAPVYVEVSPDGDRRAFVGYCLDFDEVPEGAKPPRYQFSVATSPTGVRTVAFSRMDSPAATAAKADQETPQ